MKGAYLIAESPNDLDRIAQQWRSRPTVSSSPNVIQWSEGEYLFNVFTSISEYQTSDWRVSWEDSRSTTDGPPPDAAAWWIECRSEEMFVHTLREASTWVKGSLWVLDGNDVLWPAAEMDAARILL